MRSQPPRTLSRDVLAYSWRYPTLFVLRHEQTFSSVSPSSPPPYRLSCDLENSNVDCQLKLIRTVDFFQFFFLVPGAVLSSNLIRRHKHMRSEQHSRTSSFLPRVFRVKVTLRWCASAMRNGGTRIACFEVDFVSLFLSPDSPKALKRGRMWEH